VNGSALTSGSQFAADFAHSGNSSSANVFLNVASTARTFRLIRKYKKLGFKKIAFAIQMVADEGAKNEFCLAQAARNNRGNNFLRAQYSNLIHWNSRHAT
jgi:hypothetical protein